MGGLEGGASDPNRGQGTGTEWVDRAHLGNHTTRGRGLGERGRGEGMSGVNPTTNMTRDRTLKSAQGGGGRGDCGLKVGRGPRGTGFEASSVHRRGGGNGAAAIG